MSKKEQAPVAETKELAAAQTQAVAIAQDLADWGDAPISSQDIIIPKLLLMQGQSDLVMDGKAKVGDIVDNSTNEVVGGCNTKPLRIVPFLMEKVWIISEKKKGDQRFEFVEYQTVTPENSNQAWSETIGDIEIKREYTLQFYCLNPDQPDLPFVVSFKSTSARAGKALSTQMYVRNRAAGLVPAAYIMELTSHKEKNDQGQYAVYETKPVDKTPDAVIGKCLEWLRTIKAGKTKVSADKAESAGNFASDNVAF